MSVFNTFAAASLTDLFYTFGTAAEYSPSGWIPAGVTSIPITIRAVIDKEAIESGGIYGSSIEEAPVVYVKTSDIATPRRGDTIAVGATTYTVEQVEEPQEYVQRLVCSC